MYFYIEKTDANEQRYFTSEANCLIFSKSQGSKGVVTTEVYSLVIR